MNFFKIILFVGLPGSGKTYHCSRLCDVVVDDITDVSQLPNQESIKDKILGITDVNFCDEKILNKAISIIQKQYKLLDPIEIIYFENNPKRAYANVKRRDDGRNVEGTITRFMEIYNPPFGALKIWEP